MPDVIIADALKGKVAVDSIVTVKGWVRTRRDSKGGFSFLAINDGSCFDSIQVVAPNSLSNYASEVLHVTSGASVIASGDGGTGLPDSTQSFVVSGNSVRAFSTPATV